MVCVGVLLAFFYNVVVSWALWYLVVSLMSILVPGSRLEWAYCDHPYNNRTTCNHTTTSVEEYWSRNVLAHSDHDWTNYVSSISLYFLMPCPSIGPKLFWTIQTVFDGYKLFWSGPNHFGQVQIILVRFKLDFY